MVDTLAKEHRSWNMGRIRAKDTTPEVALRSLLHRAGYRFRIHDRRLPGQPDIVLAKYRTVIFVNGCFWHRHPGCSKAYTPSSRTEFWQEKFAATVERDARKTAQLQDLGWNVVTVWECRLQKEPEATLSDVVATLNEAA